MKRLLMLFPAVLSLACGKSTVSGVAEAPDAGQVDGEKVEDPDAGQILGENADAQQIDAGKPRRVKGDINGDGFADFLIGAPNSSSALQQSGQAFVFLGGKTLPAQPSLTLGSDIILDELGFGVAMAGDVNGDGFGDFLVTTVGNKTNVGTQVGRVLLFFGGPTLKATPDIIFSAGHPGRNGVAGCGDLNGDGYDDIAFTAVDIDSTPAHMAVYPARVEIHFGGPAMATSAPLVLLGEEQPDFFGDSLSPAGDVNGDGYPDLIVGASQGAGAGGGKVRIYFGGPTMDAIADVVLEPPTESKLFGYSVTGGGDINGDGYDDVAVGAPTSAYDYPGIFGKVLVYFGGSAPHLSPDLVLSGDHPGEWFGMEVAAAGDLDNDGYDDFAVLERGTLDDTDRELFGRALIPGKVLIYRGGLRPEAVPFVTLTAGMDYSVLQSLAVTDLDGDGKSEILVGQTHQHQSDPSMGQVTIYRRSNNDWTSALVIPDLGSTDSWFGFAISR